jgi:hypothetical protein
MSIGALPRRRKGLHVLHSPSETCRRCVLLAGACVPHLCHEPWAQYLQLRPTRADWHEGQDTRAPDPRDRPLPGPVPRSRPAVSRIGPSSPTGSPVGKGRVVLHSGSQTGRIRATGRSGPENALTPRNCAQSGCCACGSGGASVVDGADQVGVCRSGPGDVAGGPVATPYRWFGQYLGTALMVLGDHSHRLRSCPHQVATMVEGRGR